MNSSETENLILVTRHRNSVATVTINRPKSLNSLTRPMMARLAQQIKALGLDESVQVIVLTGSGRAFCSGVNEAKITRFGIFPSWGLSQKLPRIIGAGRAREASLTANPITTEKWGLVNYVVEDGELLNKAYQIAETIIRNNRDLVLRYKSVINDGLQLDLGRALSLQKERAYEYYNGMTKEQFQKMQEFIAGRSAKKPSSKL